MKKILFLFALTALAFTSCKKDDDKPSYSGNFTINAKTYTVVQMYWMDISLGFGGTTNTTYLITGTDAQETTTLTVKVASKTTGDKTIGTTNVVELEIGDDTYVSTSGKITVTKFDDKTASGTFDCQFVKEGTTQAMAGTGKFEAQILSFGI